MNTVSKELLKTIERDDSLSPTERESLRKLRSGETPSSSPVERILRRREVAERLSVSRRTVDRWCESGYLPRMRLPGHSRSSGVPESAVIALIAGSTHDDARTPVCSSSNPQKGGYNE